MSKGESRTFEGSKALLDHIATHRGGFLGETQLVGRLVFSNKGANLANEGDLDIDLSKAEQQAPTPVSPVSDHGPAVVVAGNARAIPQVVETVQSKRPSITTYEQAHDYSMGDIEKTVWSRG